MEFIISGWVMAALTIGVAMYFFKKQFVWWEYLIIAVIPPIIAFIILKVDEDIQSQDVEYLTSTVVRVEYYEYWETYVHKTCTKTYDCNCTRDKDGREHCSTCTKTYDCSYCDETQAKYIAVNNFGHSVEIYADEYERIKNKFGTEKFIELNRNISHWGFCGKDGDMYVAEWDGNIDKYEPFCVSKTYINKVSKSNAYSFNELSKEQRKRIHDYPPIKNVYQSSIIGNWYDKSDLASAKFRLDRFNGLYGKDKQIKVFLFTYYNQSVDVVDLQRHYFKGGNKNELIVCVGYNDNNATWVKAFSWTDEKICENEAVRFYSENMKLTDLVEHMFPVWINNWKRKEFTPLNSIIDISPSNPARISMFIIILIINSILILVFKNNNHNII